MGRAVFSYSSGFPGPAVLSGHRLLGPTEPQEPKCIAQWAYPVYLWVMWGRHEWTDGPTAGSRSLCCVLLKGPS